MYTIFKERLWNEDIGEYISYGISYAGYVNISDISVNKGDIEKFVDELNCCNADPCNLDDYVYDFLINTYRV